MKRSWITMTTLGVLALFAGLAFYRSQRAFGQDMDLTAWPPDGAAIRKTLGPPPAATAGENIYDARHVQFAQLVQNRYRNHDPQIAIGVHFLSARHIKLLCPARMEPWYIDHIALSTWQDAQANFGHPFTMDIFSTYIGTPPLKIGELRPVSNQPEKAEIIYKFARPN